MVARKFTARPLELCEQLGELRWRLEVCCICVEVAAEALIHQNAENDADVAVLLRRIVADPLRDEVSAIEQRMATLKDKRPLRLRRKGKKTRK